MNHQWHYGDGPDRPPTSVHLTIDRFRQGDAPASIFFNIFAARFYISELATLNGRGVLFAIVDDAKIAAPLAVIAEVVDSFADVAWHEASLTTQVGKNRIYVQPSARVGWAQLLDTVPRDPTAALPMHDIRDCSFLTDPSDQDILALDNSPRRTGSTSFAALWTHWTSLNPTSSARASNTASW